MKLSKAIPLLVAFSFPINASDSLGNQLELVTKNCSHDTKVYIDKTLEILDGAAIIAKILVPFIAPQFAMPVTEFEKILHKISEDYEVMP